MMASKDFNKFQCEFQCFIFWTKLHTMEIKRKSSTHTKWRKDFIWKNCAKVTIFWWKKIWSHHCRPPNKRGDIIDYIYIPCLVTFCHTLANPRQFWVLHSTYTLQQKNILHQFIRSWTSLDTNNLCTHR